MRRQTILTAAILALALPASAETKTYDMDSFNKLSVSAGVTVIFEAGDTQSIVAENDDGNFDKLILKSSGDTLVVSRETSGGWFRRGKRQNYTVRISGPALTAVSASSGSQVNASGISGERVTLKTSSGAELDVTNIEAGDISLSASSGANLDAYGTCNSASLSSSSGATLDADEMVCTAVDASASSGSSVTGHAKESVSGSVSSGASLKVIGGATKVDVSRSSGGSVKVT